MKYIVVILALAAVYFFKNNAPENLAGFDTPTLPYVIVYGRDTCGITQKMRKALRAEGIDHHYVNIDHSDSANQLHAKMEFLGISTRRYNLPVVEVNTQLLVRPEPDKVVNIFRG